MCAVDSQKISSMPIKLLLVRTPTMDSINFGVHAKGQLVIISIKSVDLWLTEEGN